MAEIAGLAVGQGPFPVCLRGAPATGAQMHFLTVYKSFINDQECISGYARSPTLSHSLFHSFTHSSRDRERETLKSEAEKGVKMSQTEKE